MLAKLSRSIADKTFLITGASSGIGLATARVLGSEGAKLVCCDREPEGLAQLEKLLHSHGVSCITQVLDVTDATAVNAVVERAIQQYGSIYGVVNNAGIAAHAAIDSKQYDEVWARGMAVMLHAHTLVIRAVLPSMRSAGVGRIVNIASTEGLGATPGGSVYTSAKTAVIGLTRALAVELGAEGITVNCICPGPVLTKMTAAISPEHKEIFARRRVPLKRYAEPEEIAQGIVHLLLPASSYINGVALPVDGGMTIKNA